MSNRGPGSHRLLSQAGRQSESQSKRVRVCERGSLFFSVSTQSMDTWCQLDSSRTSVDVAIWTSALVWVHSSACCEADQSLDWVDPGPLRAFGARSIVGTPEAWPWAFACQRTSSRRRCLVLAKLACRATLHPDFVVWAWRRTRVQIYYRRAYQNLPSTGNPAPGLHQSGDGVRPALLPHLPLGSVPIGTSVFYNANP